MRERKEKEVDWGWCGGGVKAEKILEASLASQLLQLLWLPQFL
jgi:hypothetical protein